MTIKIWPSRPLPAYLKLLGLSVLGVILVYVCVLAFPEPMFAYRTTYRNVEIFSDQPIPPQIAEVLDDASRRLATSAIHDKDGKFKIFFCHASWRLWLYGQHFSDRVGAVADTWLTQNIYVRASDIAANKLRSPGPAPLADADQRPLSYFIAHEVTHIDEARRFGRLAGLRSPTWLFEGYADYVGKGGDFDVDRNYRLFAMDDPQLDFKRSGLYRGYHLRVALLLKREGTTVAKLFDHPPGEAELTKLLSTYRPER